jgi:hypothetical protein
MVMERKNPWKATIQMSSMLHFPMQVALLLKGPQVISKIQALKT